MILLIQLNFFKGMKNFIENIIKNIINYAKDLETVVKKIEEKVITNRNGNNSSGKSSGSGLKILTNQQMLHRLPILLIQIQAGNISIKLKNEIRQILYSLYRSKVLTKTVYNNLIKVI